MAVVVKWYDEMGGEYSALVLEELTPNGVIVKTILTEDDE